MTSKWKTWHLVMRCRPLLPYWGPPGGKPTRGTNKTLSLIKYHMSRHPCATFPESNNLGRLHFHFTARAHILRLLGSRQDEGGKNRLAWAFRGTGHACEAQQGLCVCTTGLAGPSVEFLPSLLVFRKSMTPDTNWFRKTHPPVTSLSFFTWCFMASWE